MSSVVALAAPGTALLGLLSAVAALVVTRRPVLGLGILLDFLLAAGLLRLSVAHSWTAIAAAAGVVAVRRLIVHGLGAVSPPDR